MTAIIKKSYQYLREGNSGIINQKCGM